RARRGCRPTAAASSCRTRRSRRRSVRARSAATFSCRAREDARYASAGPDASLLADGSRGGFRKPAVEPGLHGFRFRDRGVVALHEHVAVNRRRVVTGRRELLLDAFHVVLHAFEVSLGRLDDFALVALEFFLNG